MHDNDTQSHDEAMDPGSAPAVDGDQFAKLQARVAELEAINAELQETVLREKAEIENQRRRLHRVRLNGVELKKLTGPEVNGAFAEADYRGCLGLLCSANSCVFHRASLTVLGDR